MRSLPSDFHVLEGRNLRMAPIPKLIMAKAIATA
jgi:hypothetical protein